MNRSTVSKLAAGGLGAVFGAWVAGYSATTDPVPWPLPVFLIVLLIGVGLVIVFAIADREPRRRTTGSDFILRRRGDRMWELERVRGTEARNVVQSDGIISGNRLADMTAQANLGDFPPGERKIVGFSSDLDNHVPFYWIEDSGTYYSKSVWLHPGVDELEIVGILYTTGDKIQT